METFGPAAFGPAALFLFPRSAFLFLCSFFFSSAPARSLAPSLALGFITKSRILATLPSFLACSPFPLGRSKVSNTKSSSFTLKESSLAASFCRSFSPDSGFEYKAVLPENSKMFFFTVR